MDSCEDAVNNVMKFLGYGDLGRCSCVSRLWNRVAECEKGRRKGRRWLVEVEEFVGSLLMTDVATGEERRIDLSVQPPSNITESDTLLDAYVICGGKGGKLVLRLIDGRLVLGDLLCKSWEPLPNLPFQPRFATFTPLGLVLVGDGCNGTALLAGEALTLNRAPLPSGSSVVVAESIVWAAGSCYTAVLQKDEELRLARLDMEKLTWVEVDLELPLGLQSWDLYSLHLVESYGKLLIYFDCPRLQELLCEVREDLLCEVTEDLLFEVTEDGKLIHCAWFDGSRVMELRALKVYGEHDVIFWDGEDEDGRRLVIGYLRENNTWIEEPMKYLSRRCYLDLEM